jgi:hypothetical protein
MQLMKGGSIMAVPSWFDEYTYLQSKLNQLISAGQTQYSNVTQVKAAIEAAGMSVYQHFEKFSLAERTSPNTYFNTQEYLEAKAAQLNTAQGVTTWTADKVALEFQNAGFTNAYEHFSKYGWAEGVNPSNSFDVSSYLEAKAAALNAESYQGRTDWTAADVQAAFQAAGIDPVSHYMAIGSTETGVVVTEVPADEQVTTTGQTFTLTFGTDELTGTAGNDTFNAGLTVDFAGATAASFEDDDILNGGAGTDTLNVTFINGDNSAARLTDVEIVNVRVTGASATATIDAVDHVGVEQIWNDRSTSSATLVVDNAAGDVTYGVKNTNADLDVIFAAATSTTLNLALVNAGTTANDVTVSATTASTSNFVTDVNIAATGVNVVDIAAVGTAVETITVTGDGSVEIRNADVTALETIDASENKGGVTIDVATSTLGLTVTGGAGADDVSVGAGDDVIDLGAGDDRVVFAAGNFDGNDEVDGGAGTDTLSIDVADATNLDDTVYVNFEALSLSASTTGTYTIDNDAFGFETITLEDDMGDITIDNFNGGELVVQDDQTTGITIGSTGTADTVTVTVDAGTAITIGALDVTDVETVNIATASADDDVTFAAIETDGVKKITFSGAGDVIVTDITDADPTNDGTVKITNVDLTGQTGGFVMDANNLGYGTTFTLGDLGNVAATTTNDYDFDGDGTDDASSQIILTAGVRDTVKFTSNFKGNVAIQAAAAGSEAAEFGGDVSDDRIDLSFFDITIDDLTFTDSTDGLLITSDAFDGQILLVGVTGADVNNSDFVF